MNPFDYRHFSVRPLDMNPATGNSDHWECRLCGFRWAVADEIRKPFRPDKPSCGLTLLMPEAILIDLDQVLNLIGFMAWSQAETDWRHRDWPG